MSSKSPERSEWCEWIKRGGKMRRVGRRIWSLLERWKCIDGKWLESLV